MKNKNEEKVLSLLGLAARSGNILIGQKILKRYLSGDAENKFIVFSSDYGESVETLVKKCEIRGIPYVKLSVGKEELGRRIGKKEAAAVGVTEKHFVEGIKKAIING
ncbi:L7Ae/L30e/S12e/Gadd45 family ribosomal protein [Mesoaciditoga sp.]